MQLATNAFPGSVPFPRDAAPDPASAGELRHLVVGSLANPSQHRATRVSSSGAIVGAHGGYATLAQAEAALAHLSDDTAVGVLRLGSAYVGVELLDIDWDPGSLRAGRDGSLEFRHLDVAGTGFEVTAFTSQVLDAMLVDGAAVPRA